MAACCRQETVLGVYTSGTAVSYTHLDVYKRQMVYRAKKDALAADELISQYMNFIRSETARFTHAIPSEGRDDELSIAMFAFYEAVQGYERGRGSFLSYASAAIRNRLVDYNRKEERHKGTVSYDAPLGLSLIHILSWRRCSVSVTAPAS